MLAYLWHVAHEMRVWPKLELAHVPLGECRPCLKKPLGSRAGEQTASLSEGPPSDPALRTLFPRSHSSPLVTVADAHGRQFYTPTRHITSHFM